MAASRASRSVVRYPEVVPIEACPRLFWTTWIGTPLPPGRPLSACEPWVCLLWPEGNSRDTHASHAIANGMPIEIAQQNLGHASLATTTVYVKTEEKRRMRAVKKFWQDRAGQ
jgi:hypothetical protein